MDLLRKLREATVGAELEIGDVDTRLALPPGNVWDRKDSTICNSSGAANDPLKILNKYGSEIQTRPAHSPEELCDETMKIYGVFPRYGFNYTTNLHVHIRIPGLREDLRALQRIVRYLKAHAREMFFLLDPLVLPIQDKKSKEQYQGELKRYRRRLVSHWHQVPTYVYEALLKARTAEEFRTAHRLTAKGTLLAPALTVRAGVNLLQLWETDTIEFRCFTMSDNPKRLRSAFTWPYLFCEAALQPSNGIPNPLELLRSVKQPLEFQPVYPYSYSLDWIFQLTNLRHNSREQASRNYKILLGKGALRKADLE